MNDTHRRVRSIIWGSVIAIGLILTSYLFIYRFNLFADYWTDFITNLIDILAAGLCAILATVIWHRYQVSDAPHVIWMDFALGLWSWTLGEVVWGIYNMTFVVVPEVSFADIFYISGYLFFFLAMHRQFKLLFHPNLRRDLFYTGLSLAAMLGISLFFMLVIADFIPRDTSLSSFLNIFYPTADLGIALAALVFVVNFGRGVLARPWLGLIVFVITDSLYAWLYESGTYAFSVGQINLPSLIADTLYVAAYLILAFSLLHHLLLLNFGPAAVIKIPEGH